MMYPTFVLYFNKFNKMTKKKRQLLYQIAFVVTFLALVYLMATFGVFKIYAHLFSEKHLHRQNLIFRLWFLAVFSLVNYFYFVPRFYMQKRYTYFVSIAIICLVCLLILPEFVVKQPKFEPPKFADRPPSLPYFNSPVPVPLFEEVNMIVLFSISIFASIGIRTRQNLPINDVQNTEIEPIQ